MSLTSRPASRRARAVPPVEMSSMSRRDRAVAKAMRPDLSVTLSRARVIFFGMEETGSLFRDGNQETGNQETGNRETTAARRQE